MKTLTCAQMGGPSTCNTKISGNTPDEMIRSGMKHIKQMHPDMAENIKQMGKNDPQMVDWNRKFMREWETAKSA